MKDTRQDRWRATPTYTTHRHLHTYWWHRAHEVSQYCQRLSAITLGLWLSRLSNYSGSM